MKRTTFVDICNRLAARRCHDAGQSVKVITSSAKRSERTIRRWISDTGKEVSR